MAVDSKKMGMGIWRNARAVDVDMVKVSGAVEVAKAKAVLLSTTIAEAAKAKVVLRSETAGGSQGGSAVHRSSRSGESQGGSAVHD